MKALLLVALLGCTPRVPAVEPSSTTALPHCFRVLAKGIDRPALLAACTETDAACQRLRELARQRGALAGILSVGACKP